MYAREHTGMTLEEHYKVAAVLFELDTLCHRRPVTRKEDYLQAKVEDATENLRSELDEHARKECTELPKERRGDVYYVTERLPTEDECSFERIKNVLHELARKLEEVVPESAALIFTRTLLEQVEKLALLGRDPASQKHRLTRQNRAIESRRIAALQAHNP